MALTITNNSPSAGYIAWAGLVITYKSVNYNVNDSNSNNKYIWWDLSNPNDLQESNTLPTLTDDDTIVFLNVSGTHSLIPGATIYNNELLETACVQILDRTVTQLDIANTTDETTFYTYTIPANKMSTNKALRLTLICDTLSDGGNNTITIKVKLGATTMYADITTAQNNSATRCPLFMQFILSNQNSASVQVLGGFIALNFPGAAITGIGDLGSDELNGWTPIFGSATIDTSAEAILLVTVQHSLNDAGYSIRRQSAFLELI